MGDNKHNIRIIVASNKETDMPADEMYLPVWAGSALVESIPDNFTSDNTGESISFLNPLYSELTALYWGWKNLPDITKEDSYIGLVHYRRLFGSKSKGAVKYADLEKYLGRKKVFVPRKRNYIVDTLRAHYSHTHGSKALDECEDIIRGSYPDYIKSFDAALRRSSGHMFNMMIMRGDIADKYLTWLFDILYELTLRIDNSEMDDYDKRYPGRIAELLLNVWLEHEISTGALKRSDIKVLPWYMTTGENKAEKAKALLKAKYNGEKYHKSF